MHIWGIIGRATGAGGMGAGPVKRMGVMGKWVIAAGFLGSSSIAMAANLIQAGEPEEAQTAQTVQNEEIEEIIEIEMDEGEATATATASASAEQGDSPGKTGEQRVIVIRKHIDAKDASALTSSTENSDDTVSVETSESADGKKLVRKHKIIIRDGEKLSDAEREALLAKLHKHAETSELKPGSETYSESGPGELTMFKVDGEGGPTRIKIRCKEDGAGQAGKSWTDKERGEMRFCTKDIEATSLHGLKTARDVIAGNKELKPAMRKEILAELDAQIAEGEANN